MEAKDYLNFIVHEIHTTVVATVDDAGLPVTCAIDMMDSDGNSLYFLTAKGKSFYERLKKREYLSLTGMKGKDTMSCTAVSVRGKVRELGAEQAIPESGFIAIFPTFMKSTESMTSIPAAFIPMKRLRNIGHGGAAIFITTAMIYLRASHIQTCWSW